MFRWEFLTQLRTLLYRANRWGFVILIVRAYAWTEGKARNLPRPAPRRSPPQL